MGVSPLADKPAETSALVDVPKLVAAYYAGLPDPAVPEQRVAFGTSGHRGSSKQYLRDKLLDYKAYIRKHGEDMPEIRDWRWGLGNQSK